MIADSQTLYSVTLSGEEVGDLITEIDSVYKGILEDGGNLESISTLMTLKNSLVMELA